MAVSMVEIPDATVVPPIAASIAAMGSTVVSPVPIVNATVERMSEIPPAEFLARTCRK